MEGGRVRLGGRCDVCGVQWKEEEVTGQRVQVCKWLSAYPAMPESALPRANRVFRRRAPMILLTRQNKKTTRTRICRNWRETLNSQKKKDQQTKMRKTRIIQKSRQKKIKSEKQTNARVL